MAKEKTVLVVDDEERWRRETAGYLSRRGLNVILAQSRSEAEDILEREGVKIDFVISDNSMESRSAGLGLLAWMRTGSERLQVMPFILHTSGAIEDVKEPVEAFGASLLQKGNLDARMHAVDELLRT